MTRNLLKKLVIGGAIFLSATASICELPQIQAINPPLVMPPPEKKYVFSVKRDPFVPPKSLQYILRQEAKIIKSLDELTRRLEKDGFDKNQVQAAYDDKRFIVHREIIRLFDGSPETKGAKGKITYEIYRKNLRLNEKIDQAPEFMTKYKEDLALTEKKFGVDKRYIVAILGVESDFGNNKGKFYAFNALASMYITRKKNFAYRELKESLVLCKNNNKGLFDYKSSYAGALGNAQFIPSSFNRLFIDGNGDLVADPLCMEDCIPSVANYLKKSGWNSKENGRIPDEKSRNWEAIKDYNDSNFYVKAVIELATKAKWSSDDLIVASGAGFE